jgi:hypothetical protein
MSAHRGGFIAQFDRMPGSDPARWVHKLRQAPSCSWVYALPPVSVDGMNP